MQAGSFTSSSVIELKSTVLVNGVVRAVEAWSVDRELSGDLPQQVVAGSGIVQATGSITWVAEQPVASTAANPWNTSTGWLPAKGDKVEIFVGTEATQWKQFTGIIDSTTGSVGGVVQSKIVDEIDRLSAKLTSGALLAVMPPTSPGGSYRSCGLSSSYYVDQAFRAAGFFSTPRQEAGSIFHAPMQTSLWPDRGDLLAATRYNGDAIYPKNRPAPWGWTLSDFDAKYKPVMALGPSENLQLTACSATSHAGAFTFTVEYGSSANTVALWITSARVAIAYVNGVESCRVNLGSATIVSALFKGSTVQIRTNAGGVASGSGTRAGTGISQIRLLGNDNARIAGAQVSSPATSDQEFQSLLHTPTAVMDMSNPSLNGIMDAGPAIRGEDASSLLRRISEATLTAMWIDELGVMRWVPSPALNERGAVKTVTTRDDIVSLDWEDSYLGAASRVSVVSKVASISRSKHASITLWSGSGDSLESGEVREEVMEPGADEDWVIPASNLQVVGTANWGAFNLRRGTFAGVYYSSDGQTTSEAGLSTEITMERLSVDQFRIKHQAGYMPAGVVANLSTSPSAVALWDNNRNQPLPRLGGYGRVMWSETNITPITVSGKGPEFTHDADVWNNQRSSTEIVERFATFLADQLRMPKPVITGMEIFPDPRLQLGDVITINSPSLLGVRIRALIVGISTRFTDAGLTQDLSVRVLSAATLHTTYEEYDKSLGAQAMTYSQWQAIAPSTQKYSDWNAS